MTDNRIRPVILSGGAGTRLWPLSRAETPKQLLPLLEARTMIEATAARTADSARFHPAIVVTGAAHAEAVERQLGGTPLDAIIVEPAAKNTAPAIALAAHHIAATDPASLMLVMPSDHVIADEPAFLAAIDAAAPLARDGWLCTFGIRATAPETGYGYIRRAEPLAAGVHRVASFVEKPDRVTAEAYLASGDYAWNGGIFLFRADRYLQEVARHAPAIHAVTSTAHPTRDGAFLRYAPDALIDCPAVSIDYAVMEKSDRVAVADADIGWSDVGSWAALHAIGTPDAAGNLVTGDVIAIDTQNCLIRSEGSLVAAIGVHDLVIVATPDAILIVPRDRAQDVKLAVDALAAAGRTEHIRPAR